MIKNGRHFIWGLWWCNSRKTTKMVKKLSYHHNLGFRMNLRFPQTLDFTKRFGKKYDENREFLFIFNKLNGKIFRETSFNVQVFFTE